MTWVSDSYRDLVGYDSTLDARVNAAVLADLLDRKDQIESVDFHSESASLVESIWSFIVRKEYGQQMSEETWGLPQVAVWISSGDYDKVLNIGKHTKKGTSVSIDASALVPTNLTAGRLTDLLRLRESYVSKRFLFLYHMLRVREKTTLLRKVGLTSERPGVSMQRAATLCTPVPITSGEAHRTYWVNGIPFGAESSDFFEIVLKIEWKNGSVTRLSL